MVGAILLRRRAPETIRTVRIKEAAFGFSLLLWLGTLIPYTVCSPHLSFSHHRADLLFYICQVIIATKSGYVTRPGVSASVIANIVALSGESLAYIDNTPPKAALIAGWCAFFFTCIS